MRKNKKKTRVMLLLILLLVITIGYALLSTTLKINGSTSINKQAWSIYWANAQVSEGSVTPTNIPEIGEDSNEPANTKVTWSTTLSLPGDYYEFTVDAVNAGTIDAMITGIVPTVPNNLPEYVSYTVVYASDGVTPALNDKLPKAKSAQQPTTEKYKVKVELLSTITPAQLDAIPAGGLSYDFSLQVTYGQATSQAVPRHIWDLPQGKNKNNLSVGDELCIETECFNFIKYDGNDVVMLAKWNLNVGNNAKGSATGLQDSDVKGHVDGAEVDYGKVAFSYTNYWDGIGDTTTDVYNNTYVTAPDFSVECDSTHCYKTSGYSVAHYVEAYKTALTGLGATIKSARLLTYAEATDSSIGCDQSQYTCQPSEASAFINNTTFWLGSAAGNNYVWVCRENGGFGNDNYIDVENSGVRPVVIVTKNNL